MKAMRVIEFLAREKVPVRLSQIAERLGLQKSNVHRLLSTLMELGYVTQEPEAGRYVLTLKVWEIGMAVVAEHPARRAAIPYMQELHKATAETVNLTVLVGVEILYIEKIISPRPLRFTTRTGSRAPAALTASGKAMLANAPTDVQDQVREWIATAPQAKHITSRSFLATLEEVRTNGYAMSRSEWTPGVFSIAAPILGRDGYAAAALSVSGPEGRMAKKLDANIEATLSTCARIAELIGGI